MNKAWAMPGRKSCAEMGINMEYTENVTQTLPPVRGGVTGSTLKIIAIIAMFIDHTAAIVLERMIYMQKYASISLYGIYGVMRLIGRLGFPIFCFLLIEGLCYRASCINRFPLCGGENVMESNSKGCFACAGAGGRNVCGRSIDDRLQRHGRADHCGDVFMQEEQAAGSGCGMRRFDGDGIK